MRTLIGCTEFLVFQIGKTNPIKIDRILNVYIQNPRNSYSCALSVFVQLPPTPPSSPFPSSSVPIPKVNPQIPSFSPILFLSCHRKQAPVALITNGQIVYLDDLKSVKNDVNLSIYLFPIWV